MIFLDELNVVIEKKGFHSLAQSADNPRCLGESMQDY